MYVHLVARSSVGLLFHDWTEALGLWRRLVAAFPDARALCVMPNHVHLVPPAVGARARLTGVMSGYARWRGHRRGQDAACWERQPQAQARPDNEHVRRTVRYVLLNPCRGGLASDPLAWPLSTHRDLCGLGDPGLRARDPARFHAYVAADPTVAVTGTELPPLVPGPARLDAIEAAVGAVLRMEPDEVRTRAAARRLCLRAAWYRENTDVDVLATWLRVDRRTVYRAIAGPPSAGRLGAEPLLAAVLRCTGDPRFPALARGPRVDPTRWAGWRVGPGAPTSG